ncbi:hypothetical protein B0H15DRAFT_817897 [Mycena belliarum]|uniref:Uncharacterized protein n=1 Tax=Mycena belliarum TaxID=1033014 RepID=A0AAD6UJE6_9AGAR|nr:hypothetical protein B0H15DRAFT_817897 [Mycena belliae]
MPLSALVCSDPLVYALGPPCFFWLLLFDIMTNTYYSFDYDTIQHGMYSAGQVPADPPLRRAPRSLLHHCL